jgi:hypothetical protein
MADEASIEAAERRPHLRLVVPVGAFALLLMLFILLWIQRKPIAAHFIDQQLARRDVQAHYEIKQLGAGRQRLENVRIGDPANPDLTAKWVEVELSWGFRAPKVRKITARGVRLFGRIVDGKLSMGQIDKLLPAPSGAPFQLPDLNVDLDDAAMRLDTPAGRIGLAIKGNGNLSDGFKGRVAGASRRLSAGGCIIAAPAASVSLSVSDRKPRIVGPLRSVKLDCSATGVIDEPVADVDVALAPALDGWNGQARLLSTAAQSGSNRLERIAGRLTFAGNMTRTRGRVELGAAKAVSGGNRSGRFDFAGDYDARPVRGVFGVSGKAGASNVFLADAMIGPVIGAMRSVDGTPFSPAAAVLASATANATRDFSAQTNLAVVGGPRGAVVRVTGLTADSGSGAHLTVGGGRGVMIDTARSGFQADGNLHLEGGGFPATEASLIQQRPDDLLRGTARIAPIAGKGGRLVLGDISFAQRPDRSVGIETTAVVDGPLSDAQFTGLAFPVRGSFGPKGFAIGEQCTPAAFKRLDYSSLHLGPTRVNLCPIGKALVWSGPRGVQGGADMNGLRLAGQLGSSAIALDSDRFRFNLEGQRFAGGEIAIRLGSGASVSRLDLATLDGRITKRGVDGSFTGGAGKIVNVPLVLSAGAGRWRVEGGKAIVDGRMMVADEADPSRFYPLRADDFHLVLAGNRIDADAMLIDPETGTPVAKADILHALDIGRGKAVIDMAGLTFDETYQPEQLTRLTVGVVALVNGTLRGKAEIAWSPEGTVSSGTFSTEKMNLAAAFGPVTGLSTTMQFDDLLGLTTAPSQEASVDRIQAGIDVFDGRIRYQLLPGLRVRVESGRWPFAGGELALEETVLDFSKPSEKHLTFRVDGMDGAIFVQQMQFSNITATGTFDGVVPMVFDQQGGRIINGHLAARPGGGVVSYVGELSDQQLGSYGKMAFDALKALRYSKLTIDLNGALDGEFVAGVELDGVARDRPAPNGVVGYVFNQLAKIPFEFNITVRAPFRALLATMRSMKDPSGLIQAVLPEAMRDQPTTAVVQPQESEPVQ